MSVNTETNKQPAQVMGESFTYDFTFTALEQDGKFYLVGYAPKEQPNCEES